MIAQSLVSACLLTFTLTLDDVVLATWCIVPMLPTWVANHRSLTRYWSCSVKVC